MVRVALALLTITNLVLVIKQFVDVIEDFPDQGLWVNLGEGRPMILDEVLVDRRLDIDELM